MRYINLRLTLTSTLTLTISESHLETTAAETATCCRRCDAVVTFISLLGGV